MQKQYRLAVFIGRFQPFHLGHKQVVERALEIADHVLILVGSSDEQATARNPFSYDDRKNLIQLSLDEYSNYTVRKLFDYPYSDEKWQKGVQEVVSEYGREFDQSDIVLVGHSKDDSSYYLKMFPDWSAEEVDNLGNFNSTDIRDAIYGEETLLGIGLPNSTKYTAYLDYVCNKAQFFDLLDEINWNESYKDTWSEAPYPPTFFTADAVVSCSGKILLVERKHMPGKGKMALPGGYVNQKETMQDAAIRELREETKLKVPTPILLGSIAGKETFDYPKRSERGRVITQAFHFKLANSEILPKVKGSDDAKRAEWVDFSDIKRQDMFEDHYHIIDHFLRIS